MVKENGITTKFGMNDVARLLELFACQKDMHRYILLSTFPFEMLLARRRKTIEGKVNGFGIKPRRCVAHNNHFKRFYQLPPGKDH
jgi:hypothetical protein